MKLKVLSLCFATFLLGKSINAQSGAQIKAGVNLANVSVTDNGRVDEANMLTSFQVGILGDVHLASILHLQPGIMLSGKGSKVQKGQPTDNAYFKQTFNPLYIEIPANFVLKFPFGSESNFFVGAGPYLGIGVGGKVKTERRIFGVNSDSERSITFSDDDPTTFNQEEGTGLGVVKRFDYGLNGTAGIEGGKLVLSAGYGYGLAKLQSGSNNNADNNNKHRVLSFTIGIKL